MIRGALLLALVTACYQPSFDQLACGPGDVCPAGLRCELGVCVEDELAGDAAILDGGVPDADADPASDADPAPDADPATDADPETDADADADPETDAATDAALLDAPRSRERDGGRGPVDAAPPALVDAAARANVPVDAATATGRLAIGAWSPAAQVTVDGVDWRQTPVLARVLPVGPHEVVLRSPLDRAIVYQATIVIEAGKTARIQPP